MMRPEQDEGGVPEPMSIDDWKQQQEAERKQERKEMKHNGTKWHMPESTSDCVLGPNGEVTGAAGCKQASSGQSLSRQRQKATP